MKNIVCLLLSIISISCSTNKRALYSSESLKVEKISPNIYQHISFLTTEAFGNVPCNGLVYINGGEAIVFDTPANDPASMELIDWIQKVQKKKLTAVVVTHFHEDCLGGLEEFHKNQIASFSNHLTIELAEEQGLISPQNGFEEVLELKVGNEKVVARYFGQGHTIDNIIGYIPNESALFGGCLIKQVNAGKGNLEDANTEDWSKTVAKIKQEYPNLKIVVPGHGKNGSMELLDYTIALFTIE